jgi:hypothetical protein
LKQRKERPSTCCIYWGYGCYYVPPGEQYWII